MVTELAALSAKSVPVAAGRRLEFIDALRGFACLWVLLHHSFEHLPVSGGLFALPLDLLIQFSRIGWLGVSLFLVLSGFCLYYPLVRKNGPAGVQLDTREFARRRALRILPPYFAALAIFSVVGWWWRNSGGEAIGWKDVVSHGLMLHNLRPSTFASINPAFWSLALEVQLYVVFPLLVWMAARHGLRGLACLTLLVAVTWQSLAFAKYGLSLSWGADLAVAYHALPARCFEFALGMCAAALVANPRPGQFRIAGIALAVLVLPASWFVLTVSRFGPLCDVVWGIVFACGVVLAAAMTPERFARAGVLRLLVKLGVVSYSVYLIHQPLISMLLPEHFGLHLETRWAIVAFGAVRIVALIAVGVGFYCLLERPFILRSGRAVRAGRLLPQIPWQPVQK